MAYMTHRFARVETLQRVHRWLVQMGFDPSHIEVHESGTPWIALEMHPAQRVEAELLIDAAERTDPKASPASGTWWSCLTSTRAAARAPTSSAIAP